MVYHPDAVRKAYDAIAEKEEQFEKGFSLRNEIPREFIRKYLRETDIALDAGGGAGVNAILMAQVCRKVTLLDLSPRLLELAADNIREKRLAEKIDILEGDITNLKAFDDETFSFVACLGGTLSYTLDKGQQAVRELLRVAQRGATIIVGCDSKYGFIRWLFSEGGAAEQLETAEEIFESGRYEAAQGTFARLYTAGELTALLTQAGCEILELGSAPILVNSWEQDSFPQEGRKQLMELEMKFCTIPGLVEAGHHLFCVARKMSEP